MVLENRVWQTIEGTAACSIYLLERKPSIHCSNTYIILTDAMFLVIDPGGDGLHDDGIIEILHQAPVTKKLPVLIFLTHCHYDHSKSALNLVERQEFCFYLCAQESGARSLASGDEKLTLSYLYNRSWQPRIADVQLLTEGDRKQESTRTVPLDAIHTLRLQTATIATDGNTPLYSQIISVGEKDHIILYHTPGHSPDSVCYQIGNLFFTGDLFLGANPGVAGITGWNRDHLVQSLKNAAWLINNSPISTCYGGHGKGLPSAKAREIVQRAIDTSNELHEIVLLDSDRIHFLSEYTKILLEEISELFTVIAGKLLSVSYYLNSLSEEDEAQAILKKLDFDTVDAFLSDFNQFVDRFDSAKMIEMEIPLQAFQIISKINRLFDNKQLLGVIDLSLLRRVRWLIMDFLHIMQGAREEILCDRENLSQLLVEYVTEIKKPSSNDTDFLDSINDPASFVKELTRRIASRNIFESIDIRVKAAEGIPDVYIEKERFFDMITAILEPIACAGAKKMSLSVSALEGKIYLTIQPDPLLDYARHLERKIRFIQRIFSLFGGSIQYEKREDCVALIIQLLSADKFVLV